MHEGKTPQAPAAAGLCPRCGGGFHCGVADAEPCPCTTIALDTATLETLRRSFDGCLCLGCLRALSRGGAMHIERAP